MPDTETRGKRSTSTTRQRTSSTSTTGSTPRKRAQPVRRRTAVDAQRTSARLSQSLIRAARAALGTRGVTDTLTRAMEEVVKLKHRVRLMATELPDLTPELIEEVRRVRTFPELQARPAQNTRKSGRARPGTR